MKENIAIINSNVLQPNFEHLHAIADLGCPLDEFKLRTVTKVNLYRIRQIELRFW